MHDYSLAFLLRHLPGNPSEHAVLWSAEVFQDRAMFESGAVLVHLAEKAGRFLPRDVIEHLTDEAARLARVMNTRLADASYLAGEEYTIADIAAYPWIAAALDLICRARSERAGGAEQIRRWLSEVGHRPAVARGMAFDTADAAR